jgi:hypothetical protein
MYMAIRTPFDLVFQLHYLISFFVGLGEKSMILHFAMADLLAGPEPAGGPKEDLVRPGDFHHRKPKVYTGKCKITELLYMRAILEPESTLYGELTGLTVWMWHHGLHWAMKFAIASWG